MKRFLLLLVSMAIARICSTAKEEEETTTCATLAEEGKCLTDADTMNDKCAKECHQWRLRYYQEQLRFQVFSIGESERDEIFDMSIKNSTGSLISMERFEGFITLIIPIAKNCKSDKVSPKFMIESIEQLQQVWPRTVEIIVLPFEHPTKDYIGLDCTDFEDEHQKKGRPIYVMEMTNLNGPKTHPILQKLKNGMHVEELTVNTTQYFLLNPDWSKLQYHYTKGLMDMKDVLQEMINIMDHGDEL
eukprot:CAMPEP_0194255662 /NCGR_PEP_ID=MMETSP0158-20130606/34972_1 /TAXON_ID=33649 /ORGANISM="Thalassionema nitzschioides, Strain L26-B" /LENGTH=244 /DNA_ID=CAMNT_0038994101 /DNA_START=19 /DNA_END=753 /DNA_ORIENTATION=+